MSAAFTRACDTLKIDDLQFHDLRHEGTYRTFSRAAIPTPAQKVSYRSSWTTY